MSALPARRHPSATSTPQSPASSYRWTASSSGASRAPRDPCGNTPRSTSPRPTPGRSFTSRSETPRSRHCQALLHRVAHELALAGWKLKAVTTDNGSEFVSGESRNAVESRGASQRRIKPGRPTSNGCVERVQQTILEECWRPSFARSLVPKVTALRRDLDEYLRYYNTDRAHTGRHTQGRVPAEIVYGARKMGAAR